MMGLFLYIFFMILMLFSMTWELFQFFILFLMLFFNLSYYYYFFNLLQLWYWYLLYGLIALTMLIVSLMVISSNSIKGSFLVSVFLLMNLILGLALFLVFSSLNMLIMYIFLIQSSSPFSLYLFMSLSTRAFDFWSLFFFTFYLPLFLSY